MRFFASRKSRAAPSRHLLQLSGPQTGVAANHRSRSKASTRGPRELPLVGRLCADEPIFRDFLRSIVLFRASGSSAFHTTPRRIFIESRDESARVQSHKHRRKCDLSIFFDICHVCHYKPSYKVVDPFHHKLVATKNKQCALSNAGCYAKCPVRPTHAEMHCHRPILMPASKMR